MRAGYIALCGLPNAGKSTLVNRMLSEYIAVVSKKPQTTRKCLTYIYYDGKRQIVLLDTPGYFAQAKNKLDEYMLGTILKASKSADATLFLCTGKALTEDALLFLKELSTRPLVCLMNKTDLLKPGEIEDRKAYLAGLEMFKEIIPFSVLKAKSCDQLIRVVEKYLPEAETPIYDPDFISLEMERDLVEEFIREELYNRLSSEIPYAAGVRIEQMKERANGMLYVSALVYCEKPGQKKIIIGRGGSMIKSIGRSARERIERFTGKKVFLDLRVKVYNDWRKKDRFLKNMGYAEK